MHIRDCSHWKEQPTSTSQQQDMPYLLCHPRMSKNLLCTKPITGILRQQSTNQVLGTFRHTEPVLEQGSIRQEQKGESHLPGVKTAQQANRPMRWNRLRFSTHRKFIGRDSHNLESGSATPTSAGKDKSPFLMAAMRICYWQGAQIESWSWECRVETVIPFITCSCSSHQKAKKDLTRFKPWWKLISSRHMAMCWARLVLKAA